MHYSLSHIMATVTKKDLITAVATKTGQQYAQIHDLLNTIVEEIVSKLSDGEEVTLRGFGTFVIKVAGAKKGRNPNKPGSEVDIPERCVIRFRPGGELKASISALPTSRFHNGSSNGSRVLPE